MDRLPARLAGAAPLADYAVGQRVMTREGFAGVINDIHEGPADLTTYFVTLDNKMGGGEYAEAEIWPITQTEAGRVDASVEHTAADDYPELGTILTDRLPPQITSHATKTAAERPEGVCPWSFMETFMPRYEGEEAKCGGCGSTVSIKTIPNRDGQIPGHYTDGRPWNPHEGSAGSYDDSHEAPAWTSDAEDDPDYDDDLDYPYRTLPDPTKESSLEEQDAIPWMERVALYLPPHPDGVSSRTEDLTPAQREGYQQGKADGREGVTRTYTSDDEDWRIGYDLGWAEGVEVGRAPANDWERDREFAQTNYMASIDDTLPKQAGFWDGIWTNPGRFESYDWCRFRRESHCWLPKDLNEAASKQAGYAVWIPEDRGQCPRPKWAEQQACPTGEPGPHAGEGALLDATVSWESGGQRGGQPSGIYRRETHHASALLADTDPEVRFHVTARWADVRSKATKIRSAGGVRIVAADSGTVVGHVRGDTNVYETELVRAPGKKSSVAYWACGCKWASYSWGRSGPWKKYEGRMCAHALALQYEAQSRHIFDRPLTLDEKQPSWMDPTIPVRRPGDYDRDKGRYSSLQSEHRRAYVEHTDADATPIVAVAGWMQSDGARYAEIREMLLSVGSVEPAAIVREARTKGFAGKILDRVKALFFDDDGELKDEDGRLVNPRDVLYPGYHPTRGLRLTDTKASLAATASGAIDTEPDADGKFFFTGKDGEPDYVEIKIVEFPGIGKRMGAPDKSVIVWAKDSDGNKIASLGLAQFTSERDMPHAYDHSVMPAGPYFYVTGLSVAPAFQRKGIATAMWAMVHRKYPNVPATHGGNAPWEQTGDAKQLTVTLKQRFPNMHYGSLTERDLLRFHAGTSKWPTNEPVGTYGMVYDDAIAHSPELAMARASNWDHLPVEHIPVHQIIATEDKVSREAIEHFLPIPVPAGYVMQLLEISPGKYAVADGHHRLAKALLLHEPTIEAKVYRASSLSAAAMLRQVQASGTDLVAAAKAMLTLARRNEPQTTDLMMRLAEKYHGELVGLDHRLKTQESLVRKMKAETNEFGGDAGLTAINMSDTLRYTMIFEPDQYTRSIEQIIADLQSARYKTRVKNYWQRGDAYNGVNVACHTPTGHPFELQFHTVESKAAVKQTHKILDVFRVTEDPAARKRMYSQMRDIADWAHRPANVLRIDTLKKQKAATMHHEGFAVPLYRYLLIETNYSERPVTLIREYLGDDDYRVEVLRDGQWVMDNEWARYTLHGEPRSREITEGEAKAMIHRLTTTASVGDDEFGLLFALASDGLQHTAGAAPRFASEVDDEWGFEFGSTADLHEEPEPALPSTDGADDDSAHEAAARIAAALQTEAASLRGLPLGPCLHCGRECETADGYDSEDTYDNGSVVQHVDQRPDEDHIPSLSWDQMDHWADLLGKPRSPNRPGRSATLTAPIEDAAQKGARLLAEHEERMARQAAGLPVGDDDPYAHVLSGQGDADVQRAAQAFLAQKQALKSFTPAERQQFIEEGLGAEASNLDRLDIKGTHYEALEAAHGKAASLGDTDDFWMMDGDGNE